MRGLANFGDKSIDRSIGRLVFRGVGAGAGAEDGKHYFAVGFSRRLGALRCSAAG